jgi:cytochrome c oxidase assembly protein subunit 15
MIPPLFHFIRRVSYASLICVLLVILAGSVVRMSDAGMGCPDWPKCYGYLIPPTQNEQVEFFSNKKFNKGEMIVLNDTLWVANTTFQTKGNFDRSDWHKYEKHNYAHFNAVHTWIEYINRLIGAFTGLPVLLLFGACILWLYRQKDYITFLLSLAILFMLGFEAWLGKLVVDGHLKTGSITLHMLGSMLLVLLLVFLIRRFHPTRQHPPFSSKQKLLGAAFIVLVVIQVILGTQVREQVDELLHGGVLRKELADQFDISFLIHRSFSILILAFGIALYKMSAENEELKSPVRWISIFIALEIIAGVILYYLNMPAFVQPIHLLAGMFIFLHSARYVAITYSRSIASGF